MRAASRILLSLTLISAGLVSGCTRQVIVTASRPGALVYAQALPAGEMRAFGRAPVEIAVPSEGTWERWAGDMAEAGVAFVWEVAVVDGNRIVWAQVEPASGAVHADLADARPVTDRDLDTLDGIAEVGAAARDVVRAWGYPPLWDDGDDGAKPGTWTYRAFSYGFYHPALEVRFRDGVVAEIDYP
jgi:hypothetical protein